MQLKATMSDFYDRYGTLPQAEASAPGQVTVIGAPPDDSDGYVLALALPLVTDVALSPLANDQVVVTALTADGDAETCRFRLGDARPQGDGHDGILGLTRGLQRARHRITGFQALIRSSIPPGWGFASQAALQVAVIRALRDGFRLDLDEQGIARVAHGGDDAGGGIATCLAASCLRPESALFIDRRDLTWRNVPWPRSADVVVIHSGIAPHHAAAHHQARRLECGQAAARLDVASLRDLTTADLGRLADLPDIYRRRARHVIGENARVLAAASALVDDDVIGLGTLLLESHRSLRDDYQVTVAELDLLVDLLRFEPSIYGARMTGDGFGGAVVALAEPGRGGIVAKKIARRYAEQTGRQPTILVPAVAPSPAVRPG